jgi:hypothetical protein
LFFPEFLSENSKSFGLFLFVNCSIARQRRRVVAALPEFSPQDGERDSEVFQDGSYSDLRHALAAVD